MEQVIVPKSKTAKKKPVRAKQAIEVAHRYCAARFPKPKRLPRGVEPGRARLIEESKYKWLNGSTIRYWFYDAPQKWVGAESQKKVVRRGFDMWKQIGLGLEFVD